MEKERLANEICRILGEKKNSQVFMALGIELPEMKELESASTMDECLVIYNLAPSGSPVKQQALEKALGLASTVEGCLAIYNSAPSGSPVEQQALEKTLGLASTVEGCQEIYKKTTINSPLAYAAIRKIAAILENMETKAAGK